ncbi:glycosyltransferase family 1 protein [Anaerococcus sp. AGMB09787]|uniref:glycosyltransferase family 1 protein n=1 Tax=Anaerococcus sp. AGMB09787 TaxID=2922869 RepID=UPI001FAF91FC|nr:glycosyltransferase family 1 protein [Anaerococcus sp. AGMB09787]
MTIRILHVFGTLNRGGAETLVMNIYRKIDREKIQFDFLVHHEEEGAYEKEIRSMGGKIYRLAPYRLINHVSYKSSWNKLLKDHPEYKIVHCHKESIMSIIMSTVRANGRIAIAHSHNTRHIKGYKGQIMGLLNNNIYEKSDYHFACSNDAGKWMFGDEKNDGEEFIVIKNGIDIEKYTHNPRIRAKFRKDLDLEGKKVIGHVARFNKVKNHTFLIDIFKNLVEEDPSYRLVLLGEGELRKDIENKVSSYGLNDKVNFMGSVGNVNEILQAVDIFVLPSLYEGMAISSIEAQTAGLKTLLADTIDRRSKLTNLVEFIPIDKGVDPWVKAIDAALPYERSDMSQVIKNAGFDIKETTKYLSDFYLKLMN